MLRSVILFLFAVFIAVLAVSYYSAQAGANDAQDPPIIHTTSRVVNVYVVATDHDGRPMEGLNKDDFQVFDNGLRQEITFFSTREDKAAESTGVRFLAPGEYSNHLELSATANEGLTVILFDTINTAYLSQAYGLEKIRMYLRQLHPEDRVGIYALNRKGLQVVYPMDQRASALLEVIQGYEKGHPAKVGHKAAATAEDSTGLVELDRFLQGKYDHQPMRGCDPERFLITIAAFQEIARSTTRFRGRKAIIWVTEHISLPYDQENGLDIARLERFCGMDYHPDLILEEPGKLRPLPSFPRSRSVEPAGSPSGLRTGPAQTNDVRDRGLSGNDELDIVLRLLTQNNIALYPVSAEGLQTLRLFGPGDTHPGAPLPPEGTDATAQLSPLPGAMIERVLGAGDAVANVESHQAMEDLARRTGGRAYYNRNDLETGIRRALDDAKYGYDLAYYPDHDRWNGDWHKIEVKVNRPVVTVLARGGYYAFPEPKLLPTKASKQFLEEIAASPLEDTEIPVTVNLPPPGAMRSVKIEARVTVNPQTLFTNHLADGWKSDFKVLFFQLTAKNKILDVTTEDVQLMLTEAKYNQALKEGFATVGTLQLNPGATVLYVIVHDQNSDAVGSVRIPLEQYAAALQHAGMPR